MYTALNPKQQFHHFIYIFSSCVNYVYFTTKKGKTKKKKKQETRNQTRILVKLQLAEARQTFQPPPHYMIFNVLILQQESYQTLKAT